MAPQAELQRAAAIRRAHFLCNCHDNQRNAGRAMYHPWFRRRSCSGRPPSGGRTRCTPASPWASSQKSSTAACSPRCARLCRCCACSTWGSDQPDNILRHAIGSPRPGSSLQVCTMCHRKHSPVPARAPHMFHAPSCCICCIWRAAAHFTPLFATCPCSISCRCVTHWG